VDRNIRKAIDFLLGKGRFVGRDKPWRHLTTGYSEKCYIRSNASPKQLIRDHRHKCWSTSQWLPLHYHP
jgi:hypothetical protein